VSRMKESDLKMTCIGTPSKFFFLYQNWYYSLDGTRGH
jgi:hypothetical protein